MQIVEFTADSLRFVDQVPATPPAAGFVWIFLERSELPAHWPALQQAAQMLGGSILLDLHCQDLANAAHPSHYDYTSVYDLIVFRRLANTAETGAATPPASPAGAAAPARPHGGSALATLPAFARIESLAVGFAIFDRLLISVHPAGCQSAHQFVQRLLADARQSLDAASARSRIPSSPVDLVLRMVNTMVDGYLELRKELAVQLEQWQAALFKSDARSADWNALLLARSRLHMLEDLCEEQHDAMQEWLDSLREQPLNAFASAHGPAQTQRDHLVARARDVIEHIERVVHHVRRLEQSAETAVQIHFSAQSNRTNDIMKVLTTLTAIFLPLNLIAGIFGMNFKDMPPLDWPHGFWFSLATMLLIAIALSLWFWRKRYLETH